MNRLLPVPAWFLLLAALAACGGGGRPDAGPADDGADAALPDAAGDPGPGDPSGRDEAPADLPADLPGDAAADAPADAPADLPADPRPDPAPDGAPDPGGDLPPDLPADAAADLPADLPADALPDDGVPDAPADAAADLPPDAPAPAWDGLFDPDPIRDPATAECTFSNPRTALKDGVLVQAWDVSYLSWESVGGVLRPIRIRGFAARPSLPSGVLPGVVQAHGLGGFAKEEHATGTAALLGMFVLAYTGPGGGDAPDNTSEGRPAGYDNGYRMFDTIPDPRGSWFWGHAVAGLRGLTCLSTRADVDAARLGMTGFSAGGVVSLMGAAVDDRIRAAVPLSASGAWDVAVQSPKAWQHELLAKAGLTSASPEWTTLIATLDSSRLLPATAARILMVNGSADEFFPLTAHVATFDAIPGDGKRTAIAGNFDHGCFQLTSVEDKEDVEVRATDAAKGGQRAWFRNAFGTDPRYAYVPLPPSNVTFVALGGGFFGVAALVDGGGSQLDVSQVRFWGSNDGKVWASWAMEPQGNGLWATRLDQPVPGDPAAAATYVDVTYRTKDLIAPDTFSISSRPALPAGFVPDIRGITTCW